MDKLPVELIQTISNKLNYFDQINLKSINREFYETIGINKHLPGVVLIRKLTQQIYFLLYAIPLSGLKNFIRRHYKEWAGYSELFSDICIQKRTNTLNGLKISECKQDFELKFINGKAFFDNKPLNYKHCIQKCANVVRQDMFENDLIQY